MKFLNYRSTSRLFWLSLLSIMVWSCEPQYDLLIKGGTITDGSGQKKYVGTIAIKADKIAWVKEGMVDASAHEIIDATGLIVSPGFIDTHTHSLPELLMKSKIKRANINYLTQGVTTVFNGNDGFGTRRHDIYSFEPIAHVIDTLNSIGIGTNNALLVGHNQIRLMAMVNPDSCKPDKAELDSMKALVKVGMQEGAFGFSSGLFYSPGYAARSNELIQLAAEIKSFGGLYDTHIRSESDSLVAGIEEAIKIAKEAGVPLHIAHIKASGPKAWGRVNEVIELVNSARSSGQKITADQYPWNAAGSTLHSLFVPQAMQNNFQDTIKYDESVKAIREHVTDRINTRGDTSILFLSNKNKLFDTDIAFKRLNAVAAVEETDAVDVIMRLLIEGKENENVASFSMKISNIKEYMRQGEWNMFCSDGTQGHPRKFGTYPKIYQEHVGPGKLMEIEEFVKRATSLPAETFNVEKRGRLKSGFFADVIIWDAGAFEPRATFKSPKELSVGMEYVLVNGQLMLKEGQWTGRLSGKALRKRPLSRN